MSGRTNSWNRKYFMELVVSAAVQKESPFMGKNLSWESIYRLAEYHHVSNLLYYKIAWMNTKDSRKWKERFAKRYQQSIEKQESNRQIRLKLEQGMEEQKISCLFLDETIILPFYERPEMRMAEPIRILVEAKHMEKVGEMLNRMGFQRDVSRNDDIGVCYSKVSEQYVYVQDTVEQEMKRYLLPVFKKAVVKKGREYIYQMNENTLCIYYFWKIADKYVKGKIEIRDLIDIWKMQERIKNCVNWKIVRKQLKKNKIELFFVYFQKLIHSWFGEKLFLQDQYVLDEMLRYILTKGSEGREESALLLPMIELAEDSLYQGNYDERGQWKQWMFPSLEYMGRIYPKVKSYPILLPVYWCKRWVHRSKFCWKDRGNVGKDT